LGSRELLRTILEGCGYEVLEAEDGEEVLQKAPNFEPHLVILDLQMPKLDGYSAAVALRKFPALARIPIVALAAALPDVFPDQTSEAGFTQCLVKPISPARLRECVSQLLSLV
jgi:two-component system chemotaxis response regulator CheY